jgi:DNA adenine methylase
MLSALRTDPTMPSETIPRPILIDGASGPVARPIVKWAGGKRRLLTQYERYLPSEYGSYFEPFVGGAAIFFHMAPDPTKREVYLSDVNGELINLYRQVQKGPASLIKALERHEQLHGSEHYYEVRGQATSGMTPSERAARLIYLNRTCFNGLYRVNASGFFNVPMGRYKNPAILQRESLLAAHKALVGVKLRVESYLKVANRAKAGDFVYFDPPYWPLSASSNFTSYAQGNFGESDQRSLAQLFASLADRGVRVALSNSKAPLIEELYQDFEQITVQAPRFINSKADQRSAIDELLILSPTLRAR